MDKGAYDASAQKLREYFNGFPISAAGPPGASRRSIQIISVYFAFAAKFIVPNTNVINM